MHRRWLILTALTLARVAMGFQFQSIAALAPTLIADSRISYAALGTLMGAYLLPGALLAVPGGWLGKRFGDKRLVLIGLALMAGGGALLAVSDSYAVMLAGRLIAGTGAVLVNVLATKMVTDWFAGQRIVTAMGILISSWPLGIALALLSMGQLAETIGLALALAVPVVACVLGLVLVAAVYESPPEAPTEPAGSAGVATARLNAHEWRGAVLSGCVWCFYNVAFILPLSFGTDFLTARGMGLIEAGALVSLTSWLVIPALALGGWTTERMGNPTLIVAVTFVAIAAVTWMIPVVGSFAIMFALLGLIFGPAGGLIMALPARVLRSENRAIGVGIYFTVYYVGMGIFPAMAGYLRDLTGDPAAPLYFAGLMILVALMALLGFSRVVRSVRSLD